MKTKSLWGKPPSRYYRYLKKIHALTPVNPVPTLAVLGCADGKFVLPAARLGFRVYAVDVDEVALFGGKKEDASGVVSMPGLLARAEDEGLIESIEIVHGDFVELRPARQFDGVLASGALQYSRNLDYSLDEMVKRVGLYVRAGGLLYVDYMLPFEQKYKGRQNCPDASWWREHFDESPDWNVKYNRVMQPTIDLAHVEYPVDHYHQWGHMLAERGTDTASR